MLQLLTNTVLIALLQTLIPNHWLPLVVLSRSEKWGKSKLELITSIAACAHVMGTVLLGIPFAMAGTILEHEYENYIHLSAPVLLVLFGLGYYIVNRVYRNWEEYDESDNKFGTRWIIIFSVMMLLSPCLEMHSLFVAAANYGLNNVLLLALFYAFVSIGGIMLVTIAGSKILKNVQGEYIKRNQKQVTAIVLILVGILSFFIH